MNIESLIVMFWRSYVQSNSHLIFFKKIEAQNDPKLVALLIRKTMSF